VLKWRRKVFAPDRISGAIFALQYKVSRYKARIKSRAIRSNQRVQVERFSFKPRGLRGI
jgi:hypothetical protein